MKRIVPDDEQESGNVSKDPAQYMVILHTADGGSEWVDTLSKRRIKANNEPHIKDEAKRELWLKINGKRSKTKLFRRKTQGMEVWTSQKYDSVLYAQRQPAFEKSVVNHVIGLRDGV